MSTNEWGHRKSQLRGRRHLNFECRRSYLESDATMLKEQADYHQEALECINDQLKQLNSKTIPSKSSDL